MRLLNRHSLWRFGFRTCLAAASLLAGSRLFAQCVMCRTAASAQGAHAAATLNRAILILLLPALALFSGVFLLAFRGAKSQAAEDEYDTPRR